MAVLATLITIGALGTFVCQREYHRLRMLTSIEKYKMKDNISLTWKYIAPLSDVFYSISLAKIGHVSPEI